LGILGFAGVALEDFQGCGAWSSRTANKKKMENNIKGGYKFE